MLKEGAIDKLQEVEKEIKQEFGIYEKIVFMSDLLGKQNEVRNTLDTRASIIIGFNSALVVFLMSSMKETLVSPVTIIALVTLAISLILAICGLKPPKSMAKKGQGESVFYHRYINSKSLEDYKKEVRDHLNDENKIYDAYIQEAYNLTKYSNIPRKKYLSLAIRVLIFGILLSVVAYVINLL